MREAVLVKFSAKQNIYFFLAILATAVIRNWILKYRAYHMLQKSLIQSMGLIASSNDTEPNVSVLAKNSLFALRKYEFTQKTFLSKTSSRDLVKQKAKPQNTVTANSSHLEAFKRKSCTLDALKTKNVSKALKLAQGFSRIKNTQKPDDYPKDNYTKLFVRITRDILDGNVLKENQPKRHASKEKVSITKKLIRADKKRVSATLKHKKQLFSNTKAIQTKNLNIK